MPIRRPDREPSRKETFLRLPFRPCTKVGEREFECGADVCAGRRDGGKRVVPAHLTSTDCCSGPTTWGELRLGAREVFELPQPTSRASVAATWRDSGRPPTWSVGACVRVRVRTCVSVAPGRPLAPKAGMQGRCTKDRRTESLSLQKEPGIKGTRSQTRRKQMGALLRAFPVALSAAQL